MLFKKDLASKFMIEIKDNIDYRLIGIGVSNFKENQDDNFQLNFEEP